MPDQVLQNTIFSVLQQQRNTALDALANTLAQLAMTQQELIRVTTELDALQADLKPRKKDAKEPPITS
jgi:septal ring factor EnvC (AmiA/AmiB activator)